MNRRLTSILFTAALLSSTVVSASCSIMEPGNVGWFCETDDDCKDDLTCEVYVYEDSDHENQLCTAEVLLENNSENYGWILLIAAWFFVVVLPVALLILIIIAQIKNRGQPSQQQPPS